MRRMLLALALCLLPVGGWGDSLDTSAGPVTITRVMGGLKEPWGLDFLPDGAFLVTERGGKLFHVAAGGGRPIEVSGVPKVVARQQGGLLDVAVARDFAQSREIFLSYSKAQQDTVGTALVVARLSSDGRALEGLRQLFEMAPSNNSGMHFGSRIIEAPDGKLFLTLGERGQRDAAQDLKRHNGSVIRINRDGSVPADNPFTGTQGALPEIWSWGHRNPQGAALDLNGDLWVNEHGAQGGDEVNQVRKGANYGWPVISYGKHYDGAKIGIGTSAPGMEQPAHYWDPSIAPSGMMVYSGKLWPQWKGDFFVGSLKFHYLSRLDPDSGWSEEKIASSDTRRVREVMEAPDGSIWYLSVGRGAIFRITPG